MEDKTLFQPLHQVAAQLGVAVAWLAAEAEAGRVPHLKMGKRILFNHKLVEDSLLARAESLRAPQSGKAVTGG